MKLELSRAGFSAGEMVTQAILTALIKTLPVGEQRTALARDFIYDNDRLKFEYF
jgi:hypothetical protein